MKDQPNLIEIIKQAAPGYKINKKSKIFLKEQINNVFEDNTFYKGGFKSLYADLLTLIEPILSEVYTYGIENQFVHLDMPGKEYDYMRHFYPNERKKIEDFFRPYESHKKSDTWVNHYYSFLVLGVEELVKDVFSQGFNYCGKQYFKHLSPKTFGLPDLPNSE